MLSAKRCAAVRRGGGRCTPSFSSAKGSGRRSFCSGTAPGVLSALRQIVLLARARVRLYESAKENALPLAPETARRFAAECRAEEIAAARLLALSMK